MHNQTECPYCHPERGLLDAMTPVGRLSHSTVYLMHDQRYRGRAVVAYHHHATELHHLREDERNGFMANVVQVAALVEAVTGCNKINSAIYGDIVSHLHFHIVPKYDNQSEWGRPFIANPEKPTILPPDEFRQLCTLYSAKLSSDST